MVNYLSNFIQLQSTLTATLRELLHKDVEFRWEDNHTKTLNAIKTAVANITILQFYDVTKSVKVTTYASKYVIGCALLQEGKPIHFANRAHEITQMPISDMLSRTFVTNTEAFEEEDYEVLCVTHVTQSNAGRIREATEKDSTMKAFIATINHGRPDGRHKFSKSLRPYYPFHHELVTDNGQIFKANHIAIPASKRDIIPELLYPHIGTEATI